MQVLFKPTFIKDLKRLPAAIKKEAERICFKVFPRIKSLADFQEHPLAKLRGFSFYYRIRLGYYRLGFKKSNGEVVFMRILPRKDIYKYFP
jgi:mRNA interferase RelE/StbE